MKITSQQKKFALPLSGFLISLVAYLLSLGSILAILWVIPMVATAWVFVACNIDAIHKAITGWLNRDGWK